VERQKGGLLETNKVTRLEARACDEVGRSEEGGYWGAPEKARRRFFETLTEEGKKCLKTIRSNARKKSEKRETDRHVDSSGEGGENEMGGRVGSSGRSGFPLFRTLGRKGIV